MVRRALPCLVIALCLALTAALPAVASAAGSGPIASYSFDEIRTEEGVETVEDLSGGSHTATITGATSAPGKYGSALSVGKEGCVTVTDTEGLQPSEEFTFETWLRYEGNGESAEPFLTMEDTEPPEGHEHFSWMLLAGGEESPKAWLRNGEEPGFKGIYGTAPIPKNAWTHIALTDDGASLRLYVNGELVRTTPAPKLTPASGPLHIGCGNGYHFEGRIDETRLYDRVLGLAEVGLDMETPLQTPKAGPVAEWSFDEGKGTTATDLTGHGHTATISKATWTHGRFGGALKFDGKSSCVTVPNSAELNFTEEMTLEAWVRPVGSKEEGDPLIVQEDESAGLNEEPYAYQFIAGEHEAPKAWVREAGSGYEGIYGTEPLPENAWAHLTLTDDGAHLRLYVNGELVRTTEVRPLTTGDGPLQIGCGPWGNHFNGRIDEVRLYNRAITEAEVDSDMEAPVQTPKTGPIADYSFDEGSGETAEDLTGNGHTATLQGAEWTTHGRYGGALEFDAANEDFVSIPASGALDGSEEVTVEAWVRPTASPEYADILMKEREGSGPQYSYALYRHKSQAGGRFQESEEGMLGSAEDSLPAGAWTHLAITDNGAYSRLYVNGVLVDTELARPIEGHGEIRLGGDSIWGQFFDGRIDEVRIYDRGLDSAEVAADMETPIATPKAGPVADYSFDEDNEETQADTSGHNHTATVEGAKWTEHGRYGGAMEFDAAEGDVLTVPDSEELRLSEEFTLEAWVRPDEGLPQAPVLGKAAHGQHGYGLWANGNESAELHPMGFVSYDQWVNSHAYSGPEIPEHAWTHLAVTDDGVKIRLYVNGQLVDERESEPVLPGTGPLQIGGNEPVAEGDFFDGRIDEIRVYNRSLNGGEVATDMAAPIQTPQQGPIAAWSFDEIEEGGTVEDVTGNEHTGTVEGATLARGKYGQALQFDGENDVVKVPSSPDFALTEGFTVEAWVRPESESNEWAPILAKEMGGGEAATELAWWLYEGWSESNRTVGGTEPLPGKEEKVYAPDPLPVNAWSHLALTYDGAKLRLFVNGELVACADAAAPPVTNGELQIGAATEHGDYFKGRIDEARIYNRPLTRSEVLASMAELPYTQTAEAYGTNESETVFAAKINPRGIETTYRFQYGPTTAYGQTAPEAPEVTEEPISANEAVEVEEWVGGLEPETTYHFRVIATNSTGTVIGQDQTVTTEASEPEMMALVTGKEKEEKAKKEEEREEAREAKSRESWSGKVGLGWNGNLSDPPLTEHLVASGAKMFRVPIGAVNQGNRELFERLAKAHITILPNVVGIAGQNVGNRYPSVKVGTEARTEWEKQLKELLEAYGPEAPMWENPEIAEYAPTWWEIWNEPNFGSSGANGAGKLTEKEWAERYGDILEVAHGVFEETDQKAKILFGGVLSVGQWDPEAKPKQQPHVTVGAFIKNVAHYGDYDALAIHPYVFTGNDQSRAPEGKDVQRVAAKVKKNVKIARFAMEAVKKHWLKAVEEGGGTPPEEPRKAIWVTEFGWPVEGHLAKEDGHHRLVTPKVQDELVNATFNMFKGNHGKAKHELDLANLLYYNMEDNTQIAPKPTSADLEKIEKEAVEHGKNGPAAARQATMEWEASVKQARSWENHCGLREDTGGVGHEEGKLRAAWGTFVNQAK